MASDVDICNMALSHLGVGEEINILATENSQEAAVCRIFFATARDAVLRDFAWPFATKTAALALIEEDPNDEWAFSYSYPADCVNLKRIKSGVRNDTRQSRVPTRIVEEGSGLVLYCDVEDAVAEYTFRSEAVSRYPADFALALSFRLAVYIAPRLTAGDPFKIRRDTMALYMSELTRAQANALNEEQAEEDPQSEFIRTRDA